MSITLAWHEADHSLILTTSGLLRRQICQTCVFEVGGQSSIKLRFSAPRTVFSAMR